jgi:hypothetical protein
MSSTIDERERIQVGSNILFNYCGSDEPRSGTVEILRQQKNGLAIVILRDKARDFKYRAFKIAKMDNCVVYNPSLPPMTYTPY